MNDLFKKILAVAILAVIATPNISFAADGGSLIKGTSSSSVYYLCNDGKRYVFPNEHVYTTWYPDFRTVITVTDAELSSYPLGGNVTYRPGKKLVKITTDPRVYAVDAGGTLRWVADETIAAQLYGSNWAKLVDDVPDTFFLNYRRGSSVTSLSDFSLRALASKIGTIEDDRRYSIADSAARAKKAEKRREAEQLAMQKAARKAAKIASLPVDNVVLTSTIASTCPKGCISFTFDDGWESHYTIAFPILEAAGIDAIFYMPSQRLADATLDPNSYEGQSFVNIAQMQAMQASGQDIAGHTDNHLDLTDEKLTKAELEHEIIGSRAHLISMGVTPGFGIAYPFGLYNAEVKTMVQNAGYSHARSTDLGFNSKNSDKFALKIQTVDRNTTLAQVQAWLTKAAADKTWLILMFHQIDYNAEATFGTTPELLQQIVSTTVASNVDIVTMAQGVAMLNP